MTTSSAALPAPPGAIPPLESGDHLARSEFHRRYELHPEIRKAELVEGVVYVASPLRMRSHGEPHASVITWLGTYAAAHRGLRLGDNATVMLDDGNEVQPDALFRRDGGTSHMKDDYVAGPPELVVEVAASSVSIDLHAKKEAYRRNGVQEYLVWRVLDAAIDWWELAGGEYRSLPPGRDGVVESREFPGLRLDVAAMLRGDLARVLAAITGGG